MIMKTKIKNFRTFVNFPIPRWQFWVVFGSFMGVIVRFMGVIGSLMDVTWQFSKSSIQLKTLKYVCGV